MSPVCPPWPVFSVHSCDKFQMSPASCLVPSLQSAILLWLIGEVTLPHLHLHLTLTLTPRHRSQPAAVELRGFISVHFQALTFTYFYPFIHFCDLCSRYNIPVAVTWSREGGESPQLLMLLLGPGTRLLSKYLSGLHFMFPPWCHHS